MTQEEAFQKIMQALAPASLSALQTEVLCRSWNRQSYYKIAGELNHEYSYIKDVGAELWQLLSRTFGLQVTKLNLQEALAQYAQQEQTQNLPASPKCDRANWGEAVDVSHFCGRQIQLDRLEHWVMHDRCRLIAIVGIGGIGKTMLATQFAQQLADQNQFEIVLWRSLKQAPSLKEFLAELLQSLAPKQLFPLRLDEMMRQLLNQLHSHRCLLILDNIESVLASGELAGTYRSGYKDYGWLFQQLGQGRHQSSVLLTSREAPTEVAIQAAPTAPVRLLRLGSVSIEEGETILAAQGLMFSAQQLQVRELIERYQGNPFALEMVATLIKDLFDSSITAFLAEETLLFKDICSLLAQQFDRLSALEQQVMFWFAINREAVSAAQLQADLMPSVSRIELRDALISLSRRSLIETIKPSAATKLNTVRYAQQPVVMEYVTEQLIKQVCYEVEQTKIDSLRSYALLRPQAKDDGQDVQMQGVVQPVFVRLLEIQGSSENLKNLLLQLLEKQSQLPPQPGYSVGNTIHLLCQLEVNLSHLNFADLAIWQADLSETASYLKYHATIASAT